AGRARLEDRRPLGDRRQQRPRPRHQGLTEWLGEVGAAAGLPPFFPFVNELYDNTGRKQCRPQQKSSRSGNTSESPENRSHADSASPTDRCDTGTAENTRCPNASAAGCAGWPRTPKPRWPGSQNASRTALRGCWSPTATMKNSTPAPRTTPTGVCIRTTTCRPLGTAGWPPVLLSACLGCAWSTPARRQRISPLRSPAFWT